MKPQIGLQGPTLADVRECYEDSCGVSGCIDFSHNDILNDTKFDRIQMDKFVNVESHGILRETQSSAGIISNEQLILLPYQVHGFSLRSRNWGS